MYSRTEIIGRLGKDPETRFTGSGQQVTNFSVAVTEKWKKDGEKKERTTWYKIVAWTKLAEICSQYLHKGDLVFLDGQMQTREWEDKQGVKRTEWELRANTLKMLSGKKHEAEAAPTERESGDEPTADF